MCSDPYCELLEHIDRNCGGFILNLPLGRPIKLGDLVVHEVVNDLPRFDVAGNIFDPAIAIDVEVEEDHTVDSSSWNGEKGVTTTFKAAGDMPLPLSSLPKAKAGLTIEFEDKGSYVFQVNNVRYNRLGKLISVRQQLLPKLAALNLGARPVFLVKGVAVADSYTLLVAESSSAKVEITAEGDLDFGLTDLAKVELGLNFARTKKMTEKVMSTQGGTVLVKLDQRVLSHAAADAAQPSRRRNRRDLSMFAAVTPDVFGAAPEFEFADVSLGTLRRVLKKVPR